MKTTKIFKHGGSQAVRLLKAFRFEGTEVIIEKKGKSIVLRPKAVTFGDIPHRRLRPQSRRDAHHGERG
jgi:virulence-associated protein VagC